MERWPNLFIVGPGKTGTTSLYEYLNAIPDIYMSQVKEPHYFTRVARSKMDPTSSLPDKTKYLKLFEKVKDEKIIGEASTGYFATTLVPELIHEVSPDAYIIISLRNPIDRIYSGYLMGFYQGRYKQTFHDELEDFSRHGTKLDGKASLLFRPYAFSECSEQYLKKFGHKHVKILIFEEWIKDPKNTVNEILKFLGLNYTVKDDFQGKTHNPQTVPRGAITKRIISNRFIRKTGAKLFSDSTKEFLKRFIVKKDSKSQMNEEDRERLVKLYQDDVRKLEKILGREFPWPDFYT